MIESAKMNVFSHFLFLFITLYCVAAFRWSPVQRSIKNVVLTCEYISKVLPII